MEPRVGLWCLELLVRRESFAELSHFLRLGKRGKRFRILWLRHKGCGLGGGGRDIPPIYLLWLLCLMACGPLIGTIRKYQDFLNHIR